MTKARHTYHIEYLMNSAVDMPKSVCVCASSKFEAWDKATYEIIPAKEDGHIPYGAWVASVTFQNGNYKTFNTFCGKPY